MEKILGLDIGTNSIGWAIIHNNRILGMGSRIFPMGVENLGKGDQEKSKNSSRTDARGTRRQFFRKRLRKKMLLKTLSKHKMCPLTNKDFEEWKCTKTFPEDKLKEWFTLNPYYLRHKAHTSVLTLEEIGRVFYHLIQRRGFLSNSRKGGKNDGAIFKGDSKTGKIGIHETQKNIHDKTLGAYLYTIQPKENFPFQKGLERIRNRYTTRQMYIDEFEIIWEKQKQFHKEFSEDLKQLLGGRKDDNYKIDGILFHQRPLRSQKHLVGRCTFETAKTKCPLSAIPFEMFRVYQWVNTVECNGEKLNKEEREIIINVLLTNEKIAFSKLKKAIDKTSAEFKFNYKGEDKIVGTHTVSNLSNKKFFGKKWFDLSHKEQEDIWHVLYFFDSKQKVKEYALKHWGFTEKQAIEISNFNVKDGYANLSRKAIHNILPFLKLGYTYNFATVLGGVKNAFGSQWEALKNKNDIIDTLENIVNSKIKGGYIESIRSLLKKEYGLNAKKIKKLYHHSATIDSKMVLSKLPVDERANKKIQAIRNPVVVTALFELRKLVNELISDYGTFNEIKVEMARDLKSSKATRNRIRREQQRLERENDRVKKEVENYTRVTHDSILKFKLWEECKKICPYTGKQIPLEKLFTGEVQIEHIHPWSRSLNDSYANKTLCWADENRKKGNKTPFEFYGGDELNWLVIKERALKLFSDTKEYPNAYNKFKQFVKQSFDDDFTSKQLNDTRYICKEAKAYLTQICSKVIVAPGQMTAVLRYKWGLNSILNEANIKNRDDHRHHAIDALVMACSKPSYLQELSKWNRYNRNSQLKAFPMPWRTFQYDSERMVETILVSHKKINKTITIRTHKTEKNGEIYKNKGVAARGKLHEDTVYGKRKAPFSEEAYHVRKSIESLTTKKQLEKVVDQTIKQLILKRIQVLGGFVKDKIPLNTFFIVNENGEKVPQIVLPNKNGDSVPVLKIRLKENIGRAESLKEVGNEWVNPKNNHHVLIYKDEKGNLKEDVVTFWTVVERKLKQFPVYQLPIDGKEIVTTLQRNDMFLLGLSEEEINWEQPNKVLLNTHLYRVQKVTPKDYFFRKHKAANLENDDYKQIRGFGTGKTGWYNFNPIKVKISVSGKLERI